MKEEQLFEKLGINIEKNTIMKDPQILEIYSCIKH
jgi:hypothetical protein